VGDAARELDPAFERATQATHLVRVSRANGNVLIDQARAIRALEMRVIAALDGDMLRGLSNLAPKSLSPFLAARALCSEDSRRGIDRVLPEDLREVLVWTRSGHLWLACYTADRSAVWSRPVEDEDLVDGRFTRAGDLERIVVALREVLDRHTVRCDRTVRSYERASKLAARLLDVLP
jgi:hypothetical protein